jgi:predicted AlkP superfamily phosphohydrolase/phosphomutase
LISSSTKDLLVDFSQTKAFSTADGRGLQICYKDKYSNGIVTVQESKNVENELKTIFLSLTDPHTARPLVKHVFTADEIYGKNAVDPPDLILTLMEGVTASEWIRYPQTLRELLSSQQKTLPYVFPYDAAGRSGDHAEFGIFYAMGKNIKKGFMINSLTVEDILPLVFTIMNLPLPVDVTGKIPHDVFVKKPHISQQSWEVYIQHTPSLTTSELQNIAKFRNNEL